MASCEYIHDDLEPCPSGLRLTFEYDYNLQRADMFADHVGDVTVYLFDENGSFLTSRSEHGDALAADGYEMHFDLPPGRYQYLVSAFQCDYDELTTFSLDDGAAFIRTEPAAGDSLSAVTHTLEYDAAGYVTHGGMPLDTLWHGMRTEPVEVVLDRITRDTVSLTRNTKEISVTLREIDDPTRIDVDDYDFRIYARNAHLLWDNAVDESADADTLVYREAYDVLLEKQLEKVGLSRTSDSIPESVYPDLLRIELDSSAIILESLNVRRDSLFHVNYIEGAYYLKR